MFVAPQRGLRAYPKSPEPLPCNDVTRRYIGKSRTLALERRGLGTGRARPDRDAGRGRRRRWSRWRKQLGVTKGSFYWHFPTREALAQAALQRWEKRDAESLLDQVEAIADPRERLRELFRRTGYEAKSHMIYSALLRALDQPIVQPVMERVSQRRTDFLSARLPADRHARITSLRIARA